MAAGCNVAAPSRGAAELQGIVEPSRSSRRWRGPGGRGRQGRLRSVPDGHYMLLTVVKCSEWSEHGKVPKPKPRSTSPKFLTPDGNWTWDGASLAKTMAPKQQSGRVSGIGPIPRLHILQMKHIHREGAPGPFG